MMNFGFCRFSHIQTRLSKGKRYYSVRKLYGVFKVVNDCEDELSKSQPRYYAGIVDKKSNSLNFGDQ